ncbi:hypothetical protein GCM10010211_32700 [Streptomyces albospinus]|uniref:Uncharacterized protein n=1 Tax=Streptomyces albospinus TaxID=285515 RepID=A0ABQ2V408_9ACTN|nr:hypothetical protein [Streptomyces albospinus]GGU65052.1 hypothetical protein GCM10010211_32700 [Streptomyces albospinus]
MKPKNFDEYAAGQAIGPWKVSSGTVDLIGAGFRDAAEGDQSHQPAVKTGKVLINGQDVQDFWCQGNA